MTTVMMVAEPPEAEPVPAKLLTETDHPTSQVERPRDLIEVGRLITDIADRYHAGVTLAVQNPTPDAVLVAMVAVDRAETAEAKAAAVEEFEALTVRVPLLVTVTAVDEDVTVAEREAAQFAAHVPEEYGPVVEGTVVRFLVPYEVMGTHGRASTYTNHHCHGPLCGLAWRHAYARMKVARELKLKANFNCVEHGLESTYTNWGCKCDPCKAAWAAAALARKRTRRLKTAFNLIKSVDGRATFVTFDEGVRVTVVGIPEDVVPRLQSTVESGGVEDWSAGPLRVEFMIPLNLAKKLKLTPTRAKTRARTAVSA